MIHYLYADQLSTYPKLRDGMFRDRALQFKNRLGWEVEVDANGKECDDYDALNPLYVIWENTDGTHGGSMRFLPTTGPTMVNDHFNELSDGVHIESPLIWECTRFCLAPNAPAGTATALMLGGSEVGVNFHLSHAVGVFDERMVRIFSRLGWGPVIMGTQGEGRDAISLGFWEYSKEIREKMYEKSGISAAQSAQWFNRAFGTPSAQVGDAEKSLTFAM
ncbi:acyl-homoserine-lactone synthase [Falsihalocynthiibacter arcticus]|uniref:Acyl-homoserine-lactone synthase n=1 Tax=Falsihalocynthiibacter arcticus TaxID=1579316 RepID=A0A126V167_9RHOB|nr:acyl-homoserine-lactone synthase [Falsihalocynthiibacter arcticus]AML51449.1 autoinducer synthase [Falsihalocynthiibacter arcticus]